MNKMNLSYKIKPLTVFAAYNKIWAFNFQMLEYWKTCNCLCELDSFSVDKYFSDRLVVYEYDFSTLHNGNQHLGDLSTQGTNIFTICYMHVPNHVWVEISIQTAR